MKFLLLAGVALSCLVQDSVAFQTSLKTRIISRRSTSQFHAATRPNRIPTFTALKAAEVEEAEEVRMENMKSRRIMIRNTLRSAEETKNSRIATGDVPKIDPETGKPIKSDSKAALTFTAFAIAAGAVVLRVGGRAALVSAVGLDFATENPEMKENMDAVLNYASSLDIGLEGLLFVLAWTAVKVFCFDAGAVVLALSSGILFGGVLQGAFCSAAAATFGSAVAYYLAKLDTPARKKALELLEEYPSLRGIEKVVAEDGLKAILTLRLAPILPIPIGLYNYIYGVTNVPIFDFAAGIFLGSFKPYLLDSYLGVFGKDLVDGNLGEGGGLQDIILLTVLGVSILIGVFASELAGETWDSVKEEVEAEKKRQKEEGVKDGKDGIMRSLFGFEFPDWVVGAQISLKEADERVDRMIKIEYNAAVWNSTEEFPPPASMDPAKAIDSREVLEVGKFDTTADLCESLVLGPSLFKAWIRYADPLFDEKEDIPVLEGEFEAARAAVANMISSRTTSDSVGTLPELSSAVSLADPDPRTEFLLTTERPIRKSKLDADEEEKKVKEVLDLMKRKVEERLFLLDSKTQE